MKYLIPLIAALLLLGCASTEEVYGKAKQLKYEPMPDKSLILSQMQPLISATLKDPDSLKNLTIANAYRCYASKMEMSDNINPKYDYGYWCYNFSYQATNSYGGYVPGKQFAVYFQGQLLHVNELNETVRKFDNVNVWQSPTKS